MTTARQLILASACALGLGIGLAAPVQAAPTVGTYGGTTTVELDAGFVTALDSLGVELGLAGNASAGAAGVGFPIPAGEIDLETAAGQIVHTGGITLTAGELTVTLSSFIIDTTGDSPVLTGLVKSNNDLLFRAPLFDLDLPALTLPLRTSRLGRLPIPGVGATLTAEAADLLNAVFEVTAFEEGFVIGEASVLARTLAFR